MNKKNLAVINCVPPLWSQVNQKKDKRLCLRAALHNVAIIAKKLREEAATDCEEITAFFEYLSENRMKMGSVFSFC